MIRILLYLFCFLGFVCSHKLAVYWGQDSAGSLRLTLEKSIYYFCENYEYDIIPVAFLNVFFDRNNKHDFPGINLANHCNKTFKGYPSLLNCTDIARQIKQCQRMGKKILISLGGAAGLYGFTGSSEAITFAHTIWSLFLDGTSGVRPFHDAVLDGIDLDIEGGSSAHYSDFILTIRQLMENNPEKQYLITGAPQCPFPDAIMGPGTESTVLASVPQEFDYLFVQFYNNYCSIDDNKQFQKSISSWFNFCEGTEKTYGKGPKIFMGLPAIARVTGYQPPSEVETAYDSVKSNPYLGGIMLWDASDDENNIIDGRHYSSILKSFMTPDKHNTTFDKDDGGIYDNGNIVTGCLGFRSKPFWMLMLGVVMLATTVVVGMLFIYHIRKRNDNQKNIKYIQMAS